MDPQSCQQFSPGKNFAAAGVGLLADVLGLSLVLVPVPAAL